MTSDDPIVELCRFNSLIEAHMAQSRLDDYGIACFISGEYFGSMFPIQEFSKRRLYVRKDDQVQALHLLESFTVLERKNLDRSCK